MKKSFFLKFLLFSFIVFNLNYLSPIWAQTYVKTKIILTEGGSYEVRRVVEKNLTTVIQEINRIAARGGDLDKIEYYCTKKGYRSICKLFMNDKIYSTLPEIRTKLFDILPTGFLEVRGIKVNIGNRIRESDPIRESLVFCLDRNNEIDDIYYEEPKWKELIPTEEVNDSVERWQILRFIEEYRTAYNKKDIEYLEKVFSENALIIVGLVIQESNQQGDFLEKHSFLGDANIRFIKRSKHEYLKALQEKVFKRNSWIDVKFSKIEPIRHESIPFIYGVTLHQEWNSQYYSDNGYLFLMFDFRNREQPIIHVRSWQPRPFSSGNLKGAVVNLYLFDIEDIE